MSTNKRSIIIAARPDHSVQIYDALLKSNLNFLYVSFKLFPRWMSSFIPLKRVRYVSRNARLSYILTFSTILAYNFNIKLFRKTNFKYFFERKLSFILKNNEPKVLHYWPSYCLDVVDRYKKRNPQCVTMADLYYPNEQFILDEISPVLKEMGLQKNLDKLCTNANFTKKLMDSETRFVLPSHYMVNTFKRYYPDKTYYVVSYGINKYKFYKRRKVKVAGERISKFVFAGTISVEKGCNILCELFSQHPDLDLYMYGNIHFDEVELFKKYKNIPNIHFMGSVSKETLHQNFLSYDVGIHTSWFDAYSLSVSEMIGTGLPVIVSDKTGNMDEVQEHELGLVATMTEQSILDAILSITNLDNYNHYLSSIDHYLSINRPSYGEKLINLYKELIHEQ